VTAPDSPEAAVVWWKTSLTLAEIPRRHIIRWTDITGAPSGTITIPSPHPRLDRRTIESALTEELTTHYPGASPRLGTEMELNDQLSAEARLRVAGHRVLTRALTRVYGWRTVGGVVATLLGKGIDAYVLIDEEATRAVREAVCQEAGRALAEFSTANPDDLYDGGWERGGEDRWQLLLEQR